MKAVVFLLVLYLSSALAVGVPCSWRSGTVADGDSRDVWADDQPCIGDGNCLYYKGTVTCQSGVMIGQTNYPYDSCSEKDCSCLSPDGVTIAHGEDYTVHSVDTTCGLCSDFVGQIHCNNSILTGDTDYAFDDCIEDPCSCDVNGYTIDNGGAIDLYTTNSVNCGFCSDEMITVSCDDGIPTSDGAGYDYDSCDDSSCIMDCTHLSETIVDGGSLTVYQDSSPCGSCVSGSVLCTSGTVSGDDTYAYTTCTPVSCGGTGGDPHFNGFKGQKYDVMGQSHEIYNFITSPNMQINSRFVPYYKTANQVVPTGTMMGELGIKFGNHRFYVSSNETVATLDNLDVDLLSSWSVEFDGVVLSNVNEKGRMYQINFANNDVSVTFIRKLYTIRGLEDQWHFDYHAKLFSSGNNLHGLMGQTWNEKNFADKSGAFKYLDGEEENYRIKSNNIFGDDFDYNMYNKQ